MASGFWSKGPHMLEEKIRIAFKSTQVSLQGQNGLEPRLFYISVMIEPPVFTLLCTLFSSHVAMIPVHVSSNCKENVQVLPSKVLLSRLPLPHLQAFKI